jgi:hypothetical protein
MVNPYRFYTYAYLREDRTPYYIGKGQTHRAFYKRSNEIKPPKDKSRIIFLKQNLTEEEAFKHEKYMIAVFGRKDLGTGILRNRTDGGEGVSNWSEESKNKLRNSRRGIIFSETHRERIGLAVRGRKLTEEQKIQRSLTMKKIWQNEEYRKNQSKKAIENNNRPPLQSGKNHYLSKVWKITFKDGSFVKKCGLTLWAKENNYDENKIYLIAKGKRKTHKDIVAVEKLDTAP